MDQEVGGSSPPNCTIAKHNLAPVSAACNCLRKASSLLATRLRQAQIGIAVSTATDAAKSAAGVVLTEPGLAGIVAAVKEGRYIPAPPQLNA